MTNKTARVHCRVFEDNSGALTIETLPKIKLLTKHINNKYRHFRDYVEQGKITIHAVNTKQQIADMLTKPLAEREFTEMKIKIMEVVSDSKNQHFPGSVRILVEHKRTNGMKETNDKNKIIAITKTSQIGEKITTPRNHTAPREIKGERHQRAQEILVNKMIRSEDKGFGNEVTGE